MKFKNLHYSICMAILVCVRAIHPTTYPEYVFTATTAKPAGRIDAYLYSYNASSSSWLGVQYIDSISTNFTGLSIVSKGSLFTARIAPSGNPGVYTNFIDIINNNWKQFFFQLLSNTTQRPVAVTTPDNKYVLVTANRNLIVCDAATGQIKTSAALTNLPSGAIALSWPIAISPIVGSSGYTVFVSVNASSSGTTTSRLQKITVSADGGTITIGTAFNVPAAGGTLGGPIAFTPDGSTLYVVRNPSSGNRLLYPVNPSTNVVGSVITIPDTTFAVGLVIAPNGQKAYVITGNNTSGNVNVVDLTTTPPSYMTTITLTNAQIQTYACTCAAFNADGSKLYVAGGKQFGSNLYLFAIDTASLNYTSIIAPAIPSPGSDTSQDSVVVWQQLAVAGALDTSFGNQGYTLTPLSRSDSIQDLAIQSDDKILVTGTTLVQKKIQSLYLARYTSNGILDTSTFNAASTPGYSILQPSSLTPSATACAGNAIALDASSNILVAGFAAQNPTSILLARYTPSGILDTTFNSGGALPGVVTQAIASGVTASAVGVQSGTYSNRIIVGGTVVSNGVPGFLLAGFDATTGALDTTFGGNGTGYRIDNFGNISLLKAMLIVPSTAVYATPDSIYVTGNVDNQIWAAQYDPAGNLLASAGLAPQVADNSYNASGNTFTISLLSSSAYDMAYVDNSFDQLGELYIAGSALISVDNQPAYFPYQNAIPYSQGNGNLILPNQLQSLILCLYTDDLTLGTVFNTPTSNVAYGFYMQSTANGSEFYSVALQPNNNIVVGGYAKGDLANQLSVAGFCGYYSGFSRASLNRFTSGSYGIPNVFWNNSSSPSLQTIGSLTAARRVRSQSTNNVITAGTADGIYCIARFLGGTQ